MLNSICFLSGRISNLSIFKYDLLWYQCDLQQSFQWFLESRTNQVGANFFKNFLRAVPNKIT